VTDGAGSTSSADTAVTAGTEQPAGSAETAIAASAVRHGNAAGIAASAVTEQQAAGPAGAAGAGLAAVHISAGTTGTAGAAVGNSGKSAGQIAAQHRHGSSDLTHRHPLVAPVRQVGIARAIVDRRNAKGRKA